VLHDLDLVDIAHRMKQSQKVKTYISENVLQTEGEYIPVESSNDLRSFKEARPDGVVEVTLRSGTYLLALEYEANRKRSKRYEQLFRTYYRQEKIQAVLYICKTREILKRVSAIEKRLFPEHTPLFFYTTLSELHQPSSLVFQDWKERKLILQEEGETEPVSTTNS